jgi:hypothetical protein
LNDEVEGAAIFEAPFSIGWRILDSNVQSMPAYFVLQADLVVRGFD